MSKRSFEPVTVAGLRGAEDELDAKLKSPKSLESSVNGLAWGFPGVLEARDCFGASFGPVSKKLPPLSGGEVTCGAATEDRWLTVLLKLAKGSLVVFGGGFAGVEVAGLKFRLLKASSRPPRLDCCCAGGDCSPPKEPCLSC